MGLVLQHDTQTGDDTVEIWLPDGRTIDIKLVDVRDGHRARVKYTAPADVKILRKKLADRARSLVGVPGPG